MRRLRPVELRPYDYGQAVITEGLWFAEGITSYYDLSLPLLAGCSDRPTPAEGFRGGAVQRADVSRMFSSVVGGQCP